MGSRCSRRKSSSPLTGRDAYYAWLSQRGTLFSDRSGAPNQLCATTKLVARIRGTPVAFCSNSADVALLFGSSLLNNSPGWYIIWSIAVTEWYVIVAMVQAQAAVNSLEFDTHRPDTKIYPSGLVAAGCIFRLPECVITGM